MNTADKRQYQPTSSGLEGIVVADTNLSLVDGEKGQLLIGGYDVEKLALRATFEDMAGLLMERGSGEKIPIDQVQLQLASGRKKAFEHFSLVTADAENGMDFLRTAISSLLPSADPLDVIAALPVAAALWHRRKQGLDLIEPRADLSHAADYLHMILGRPPIKALERALESYLVTVSDHGMNASTFASRVVASTGSDLISSIVAGIGALKGPLHGGAPGPVLDMLDAIGSADHARTWLESEMSQGRRIMGMGHRIYRVRDPRAAVLEKALEKLEQSGIRSSRLMTARSVEASAIALLKERYPNRPLQTNVEFYTAVLLDAIGIPRELFSPTFAVGRVVGWCAHVLEQRACGRLIRPDSRYIGSRF